MRKKQQKQMPLIEPASGHPQEMELEMKWGRASVTYCKLGERGKTVPIYWS